MLLHICSKIMKISLTVQSFRTDKIFIPNIPKENNSEKKMGSHEALFVPSFMKISMTVLKL